MAVINGVDVNKNFIEKVFMEIKKLYVPIQSGIPNLKLVGDNLYIRSDDLVLYNNYREIIRLLSFTNKDVKELYLFDNFAIKTSDFDVLYKLACGSDLYNKFSIELNGFEQYGKMPGYSYNAPIPRQKNQSIDDYERYLEGYYGKHGYVVKKDNQGIRKPYPHELFKWSRGNALSRDFSDNNYVSPYYREYVNSKVPRNNNGYSSQQNIQNINNNFTGNSNRNAQPNSTQNQNTNSNSTASNTSSNASTQRNATTSGASQRTTTGKRKYGVKSKTPFGTKAWDTIMGAPDSIRSFGEHMGNNWPNIKAFFKRHALPALGVLAGLGVAAGAIALIMKAFEKPAWIGIATTSGSALASDAAAAGLMSVLTNFGIALIPSAVIIAFALLRRRWKAQKEKEREQEQNGNQQNEFTSLQDILDRISELRSAYRELEKRKSNVVSNNGDQNLISQIDSEMSKIEKEQIRLLGLVNQFTNSQNINERGTGGPSL